MIVREIPGKLFLMGEYAVMHPGYPALIFAVDRCLRVSISPSEDLRVEIPAWRLDLRGATMEDDSDGDPRAAFVRDLLRATFSVADVERGFHLVVEPHAKDLAARDLGLGTSSALAVALAQALLFDEVRDSTKILALALGAHRQVQGGRGSGADVTTAWAGRSIRFECTPTGFPRFKPLGRPGSLHFSVAYTGISRRTSDALHAFEQVAARDPRAVERFRESSATVVEHTLRTWSAGGRAHVANLNRAAKLLDRLAKLLNEDTPIPEFLSAAARAAGGVIKTSGGIGGDCCCIAAETAAGLTRVEKMAEGVGFEVLDAQPIFGDS